MDEHLAAWQIAEFIVGGLDEDELEWLERRGALARQRGRQVGRLFNSSPK